MVKGFGKKKKQERFFLDIEIEKIAFFFFSLLLRGAGLVKMKRKL
jgi:hypothetical protein